MYLQTPCNEPNSASPISDASKARTAATLNWAANAMESGNRALNELMVALHGNPIGSLTPGNAGVPTGNLPVGLPGGSAGGGPGGSAGGGAGAGGGRGDRVAWIPRPSVEGAFPRYGAGSGFLPYPTFQPCRLPTVLPLETVRSFRTDEPVSTVPIKTKTNPKANPVQTPAKIQECDVTPATICQALRDGCVLSSQVTPEQLFACSQAGWVGNRNLFPALAARGGAQGGKFFGSMNLSPDPPPAGVSGFGDVQEAAGGLVPPSVSPLVGGLVQVLAAPASWILPSGGGIGGAIAAPFLGGLMWAGGLWLLFGGKKGRR